MGKETVELFKCDICGSKSHSNEKSTSNWVAWDQTHPVVSREWISRCICPDCVGHVQRTIAHNAKVAA